MNINKVALLIVSSVVVVFLIGFATFLYINTDTEKHLAINDIKSDPLAFSGEVTLNGVVAGFAQDNETIFALMDTEELLICKDINCGAFQLATHYEGNDPLPEFGDEINVTGSFIKDDVFGVVFKVTNVDVKRNILSLIS